MWGQKDRPAGKTFHSPNKLHLLYLTYGITTCCRWNSTYNLLIIILSNMYSHHKFGSSPNVMKNGILMTFDLMFTFDVWCWLFTKISCSYGISKMILWDCERLKLMRNLAVHGDHHFRITDSLDCPWSTPHTGTLKTELLSLNIHSLIIDGSR